MCFAYLDMLQWCGWLSIQKGWFVQNFAERFILHKNLHGNEMNLFNETWCMNVWDLQKELNELGNKKTYCEKSINN